MTHAIRMACNRAKACHHFWQHGDMGQRITDRLLGLLDSRERWTAQALADALGISLRSVRRGLAELVAQGVTLDSEPGRGGGVRLARRSGLPRMALSQREVITLLMGLAVAESYGAPLLATELKSLRFKLSAVLGSEQRAQQRRLRERVLIGAPASSAVQALWRTPRPSALAEVQEAFFSQTLLRLRYQDAQGQTSEREVETQYLLINAPVWYLLAWDLGKQAPRCFRLDRVLQAQALDGQHFLRRPAASLMQAADQFFDVL